MTTKCSNHGNGFVLVETTGVCHTLHVFHASLVGNVVPRMWGGCRVAFQDGTEIDMECKPANLKRVIKAVLRRQG